MLYSLFRIKAHFCCCIADQLEPATTFEGSGRS